MKQLIHCHRSSIEQTLSVLKDAGRTRQECLVLWLGQRGNDGIAVRSVLRPQQIAGQDFFRIPPHSMRSIMKCLRDEQLMIAAQVHSHPFEAFHSEADDRWAIVRHVGALSFVVPYFAKATTPDNFLDQSALFLLDSNNRWIEVPTDAMSQSCQIHN